MCRIDKIAKMDRNVPKECNDVQKEKQMMSTEDHDKLTAYEKAEGRCIVNPFKTGEEFINYCAGQGWLIKRGNSGNAKYFVTKEGRIQLKNLKIFI
jgi:hypothetical protein